MPHGIYKMYIKYILYKMQITVKIMMSAFIMQNQITNLIR